ncbi:MAG: filamentous hemagglutinin N-terminal domain-containing protein [Cyanobacteria bacterium P01_D01_bin.36]
MNTQQKHLLTALPFHRTGRIVGSITITSGLLASPVLAQSISIDGSTTTQLNGAASCSNNCTITGGLRDGGGNGPNLFHSFSTFNVDNGSTVTFTDPGVDNIFNRVTGNFLSTINGTLKVEGAPGITSTANLFLLNSNGILFDENAKLDIQGSFISSTADSILFQNDTLFSTTTPADIPSLLTVNVPLGLQFGQSPEAITVSGNRHSLSYNPDFTITRGTPSSSLSVNTGQTLALLGGTVNMTGGNLAAPAGHIEVASLNNNALVRFDPASTDWAFTYGANPSVGNINLADQSSIDVSDNNAGSVHLQGRQINLSNGSAIVAQVGQRGDGKITLDASETINVTGVNLSATSRMPTGVYIEVASGAIGDGTSQLTVNAAEINLAAGGQIGFGLAGAGPTAIANAPAIRSNVTINAPVITANGGSNANPSSLFSGVLPTHATGRPFATGQGGDLDITTQHLTLTNGAQLIASTFSAGDAGNLTIHDAATVEVRGFNAGGPSSIVSASEVPFAGSGGQLTINTDRLVVADGGQVSVNTVSASSAGNLTVRASPGVASQSIELRGGAAAGRSGLFAGSNFSTGAGGNIHLDTEQLSLSEGATINVSNFPSRQPGPPPGTGPAGNITVLAESITLEDDSLITADTVAGDRANINLQSDSLVLRRGSRITTNATGTAIGGNITLNTTALIALENSDITANAADNFGGRIVVNANSILGTAYRENLTTASDITASSALGPDFSGTVEINDPAVDPTDGITELPEGLSSENQIAAACEQLESNTFVATGRGGIPEDAGQLITGQSVWNDFRFLPGARFVTETKSENLQSSPSNTKETNTKETNTKETDITDSTAIPVEAQNWSMNSEGQVILGASTAPPTISHSSSSCLEQ